MAARNRSKIDRSKCSGAWFESRSSARTPIRSKHHRTKESPFRWVSMTPLGTPVEPEVYRMYARSSSITPGSKGGAPDPAASSYRITGHATSGAAARPSDARSRSLYDSDRPANRTASCSGLALAASRSSWWRRFAIGSAPPLQAQPAGDDPALDLRGPRVDRPAHRVAQRPLEA